MKKSELFQFPGRHSRFRNCWFGVIASKGSGLAHKMFHKFEGKLFDARLICDQIAVLRLSQLIFNTDAHTEKTSVGVFISEISILQLMKLCAVNREIYCRPTRCRPGYTSYR